MKSYIACCIILTAFVLLSFENLKAQSTVEPKWATAHEMNQRLGRGINIGNTFEALPAWQSKFDPDDKDSRTWFYSYTYSHSLGKGRSKHENTTLHHLSRIL